MKADLIRTIRIFKAVGRVNTGARMCSALFKRIGNSMVLTLAVVAALVMCVSQPARATLHSGSRLFFADKPMSDDSIYDQVKRKLANDPDVKGGALDIDVKEGAVTLRGKVETERQKQKAEKLAKKVSGVKKVINEIQLSGK
jgi:osmotically-inducible protein OsmY